MNYTQIGILLLQGTLVSSLILLLFYLRKKLGIGILFACLGLFQFMQALLARTVFIEISQNLILSPGTSVLFTATLFAILLIYIKEDASETRKLIYALVITNIVMVFLLQSIDWNVNTSFRANPFYNSINFFTDQAWILLIGTLSLFIDALLIIVLFEFISKYISHLFINICLTMLLVVSFDSIFFSGIAFWKSEDLNTIIVSNLFSKSIFTVFYSALFYVYLRFIEPKEYVTENFKIKDMFQTLTYRQKFELANQYAHETSKENKLKELKYHTLTNMLPVGIFHTTVDGLTTFVNPKWCEIAGITKQEALADGWKKVVHPDDVDVVIKEWKYIIARGENHKIDYRFLLPDGSIKWVLGRVVPERNNQNEIIGFVGAITDITTLKEAEEEQIRMIEKAEESNLLKSAFLANMSHEIRTPMNGILGFTNLLKEPDHSIEAKKQFLEMIDKSGQRMLSTINDIINISKIEAKQVTLNFSEIDLNTQLEEFLNFFLPDASKKGIQLSIKGKVQDQNAIFFSDKEKLDSIVTNLLNNAIKYTNQGSIEFGYHFLENEGHKKLRFYVKDTGVGIQKERQEAVFERFVMADIQNKQAFNGSGLGLAICKAYVEMLSGKIQLDSEIDKGSTFSFTLPYKTDCLNKR